MECKICGGVHHVPVYTGKIRMGRFGTWSEHDHTLCRCANCGAIALPNLMGELSTYYETGAYREDVDGEEALDHFYALHDGEQGHKLALIGTDAFRKRVVADIGCGAGSFLDFISGAASEVVAVEPNSSFRSGLQRRGYHVYDYAANACADFAGRVGLATCFSTVEHIEDPLSFLQHVHALLEPGGKLVISTPNANDILMHSLPEDYPPFFYRKVHLWYWDAGSFRELLKLAGFSEVRIIPHHRFGMSNFFNWLREKRPKGDARLPYVTETMDRLWRAELEQNLTCDYLYAEAVR